MINLPNFTDEINVDMNNPRRMIRLIEKLSLPSHISSDFHKNTFNMQLIGLTMERSKLYEQVDLKIKNMFKDNALPDEVSGLIQNGYHESLSSMTSIGYSETNQLIKNDIDLETCIKKSNLEHINIFVHNIIGLNYTIHVFNGSILQIFPKNKLLIKSITTFRY